MLTNAEMIEQHLLFPFLFWLFTMWIITGFYVAALFIRDERRNQTRYWPWYMIFFFWFHIVVVKAFLTSLDWITKRII